MKLLLLAVALIPLSSTWSNGAVVADRPNIVFIITDDQSWDSLGFMGGKVHTPRIDQMAKDGLYLSDFNVTSTVCSPSRYSFIATVDDLDSGVTINARATDPNSNVSSLASVSLFPYDAEADTVWCGIALGTFGRIVYSHRCAASTSNETP